MLKVDPVNGDLFEKNFARLHARINRLNEQLTIERSETQDGFSDNTLHDLQDSLEELLVVEEELRQQNEELNNAQEELKIARKRYQDLFNFAPDGYLITDIYGKILEANVSAAFLLDKPQELLGNTLLFQFVSVPDRKEFRQYLARVHRELMRAKKDFPKGELQADLRLHKSWELKLAPSSGPPIDVAFSVAPAEVGEQIQLRWLIRDITQNKRTEQANRDLLHRLVTVQEEEIRHIARELHDQMGQRLTALLLGLKNLENTGPEAIRPSLKKLQAQADEIGQEVHQLSFALRPAALDDLNLTSVLANYAEEWSERHQVEVDYQANVENDEAIPSNIKVAVYRIVQEALSNIARHAHASRVSLILTQNENQFLVVIEDDGSGFNLQNVMSESNGSKHLGLLGIQERTQLAGGSLQIESVVGKGTTLFIKIPLVDDSKKAVS